MAGLTPAIVDAGPEPGFDDMLEARLLDSLRADTEQATNAPIRLVTRAVDGTFLAGLSGHTSYGWLHLNMLWVAPDNRCRGYARQLVSSAQDRALSLGCHSVWLDTSNPSAFSFWKKLGFTPFGCLENAPHLNPAGHQRWFLQKSLV